MLNELIKEHKKIYTDLEELSEDSSYEIAEINYLYGVIRGIEMAMKIVDCKGAKEYLTNTDDLE